jgi:hypothetical protein
MPGGSVAPFWTRRARPVRGTSGPGPGSSTRDAAHAVRWFLVRVAAAMAAILIVVVIAGFLLARQASGPTASWARSGGDDALWLAPGAAAPRGSIPGSIDEVFVPAGQLASSGRLATRPFRPIKLTGPRISAVLTGTGLNLDDASVRAAVLASAAAVLGRGYTGLQLDLSGVASGDQGLLTLLAALRSRHVAPLSVLVPKIEPLPGLSAPAALLSGHPVYWTSAYLTRVAGLVSQVALLSSGTGMPFPSWYSGYVRRETTMALRAVPAGTGLLIVVPAGGGTENAASGIQGIRVALTALGHTRPGFGVGLFDTSAVDWSAYSGGWADP